MASTTTKAKSLDSTTSYKVSPSSLNVYKECPRCFWRYAKNGTRRPEGITPSLPNGIDRIMKLYFDGYQEFGTLPPQLESDELRGATLFSDRELLARWQDNYKGISCKVGKHTVRGAVDYVLQRDDRLIVLDFKTRGFALKQDSVDRYQDQLNLYNFMLRENGYKTEDDAYLLYIIPRRAVPPVFPARREKANISNVHMVSPLAIDFDASLIKVPVSIDAAAELVDDALSLLGRRTAPPRGKDCKYC